MPSSEYAYNDELLTRYLLGDLPAEQAEQLDELSVVDDEFAWRLNGVENELVDGFVRGELEGETLQKFQSVYLASPRRRQKVEFAAGLFELEKRTALQAASPKPTKVSTDRWGWLGAISFQQWGFAAAAVALLLIAAFLFTDNLRLRRQVDQASSNSSQHEQQLQQELDRQRAANAEIQGELDHARSAGQDLSQLKTVSLLLPPPTRGVGPVQSVAVHPRTDLVAVLLTLESDDFPQYRVALKDPATQREVWHSPDLSSSSAAGHMAVAVSVPAKLLQQQHYLAELTGIRRNGATEPIGDYPFGVILR
ncbi:MAG TPA: hypothetical protein VFR24_12590 [Candidatus Angelobacter sp.]|nr:hypothetical protein [Candidatus Angelobacter sp.]